MSSPSVNLILADAMVDMVGRQRQGIDDLFRQDIKELVTSIARLDTMLEIIKVAISEIPGTTPEVNMAARVASRGVTHGS